MASDDHQADVRHGSWLRENPEIEFANGNFVSTSVNLKSKSAGDGCRDKTIEKTILRTFRARTFSRRCAGRPARSRWCKSTTMTKPGALYFDFETNHPQRARHPHRQADRAQQRGGAGAARAGGMGARLDPRSEPDGNFPVIAVAQHYPQQHAACAQFLDPLHL